MVCDQVVASLVHVGVYPYHTFFGVAYLQLRFHAEEAVADDHEDAVVAHHEQAWVLAELLSIWVEGRKVGRK